MAGVFTQNTDKLKGGLRALHKGKVFTVARSRFRAIYKILVTSWMNHFY